MSAMSKENILKSCGLLTSFLRELIHKSDDIFIAENISKILPKVEELESEVNGVSPRLGSNVDGIITGMKAMNEHYAGRFPLPAPLLLVVKRYIADRCSEASGIIKDATA